MFASFPNASLREQKSARKEQQAEESEHRSESEFVRPQAPHKVGGFVRESAFCSLFFFLFGAFRGTERGDWQEVQQPTALGANRIQVGADGKIIYVDDVSRRQDIVRQSSRHEKLKVVREGGPNSKAIIGKKQEAVQRWSPYETDKMYDCVRMFGTDFTLIADRFKNRNRKQIKAKYMVEEKTNPAAITWALKNEYLHLLPEDCDPFVIGMPCEYRGYPYEYMERYWRKLKRELEKERRKDEREKRRQEAAARGEEFQEEQVEEQEDDDNDDDDYLVMRRKRAAPASGSSSTSSRKRAAPKSKSKQQGSGRRKSRRGGDDDDYVEEGEGEGEGGEEEEFEEEDGSGDDYLEEEEDEDIELFDDDDDDDDDVGVGAGDDDDDEDDDDLAGLPLDDD